MTEKFVGKVKGCIWGADKLVAGDWHRKWIGKLLFYRLDFKGI